VILILLKVSKFQQIKLWLITLYDGATLCAFIFLYFIRFFTLSVPAVVEL